MVSDPREMQKRIQTGAQRRDIEFSLTYSWFSKRLKTGHCEETGIPFATKEEKNGKPHPYSASVDRIDNDLGYTPENSRMVVWALNAARNTWGDEPLFRIVDALRARQTGA